MKKVLIIIILLLCFFAAKISASNIEITNIAIESKTDYINETQNVIIDGLNIDYNLKFEDFSSFIKLKEESLFVLRGNLAERYSIAKTINIQYDNIGFLKISSPFL